MIRLLISALTWLDKRFPPTVTVTKESFDALLEREHQRAKSFTSLRLDLDTAKDRVKSLETSVSGIKDMIAKGVSAGPAAEKRRADFIASGRMGE